MLLLLYPALATLIGADPPKGWLPLGASRPLPAPPQPALIDLRILQEASETVLAWSSHEPGDWTLASAKGEARFPNLASALAAAELRFEIGPHSWPFDFRGRAATSDDVTQLVGTVLGAHGIDSTEPHGWGSRVSPPRLVEFTIPGGQSEQLWLVLEGDYVVFFDPATGDCGLGTCSSTGAYTYIGDYGPLWTTLVSM